MATRECTVTIQNKTSSFILCDPCHTIIYGSEASALAPALHPSESYTTVFQKTPYTACGSVAVFTYNILQDSTKNEHGRMAVMFSVPYESMIYSDWYAVGVFNNDKKCDNELFKEMYYDDQVNFVRGKASGPGLTYRADTVTVRASMSDSYHAELIVELCDY